MSLAVTVTAGASPVAGVPISLAMLRRLGLPTVGIAGTVGHGDLSPGAVQPDLVTPGAYVYAAGTLATGVYSVTLGPALTGYANGVELQFKADAENTGAVSLNVNALGDKPIYRWDGIALEKGDIRATQIVRVVYNASWNTAAGAWQLQSTPGNKPVHYQSAVATGTDTYVVTCAPTCRALVDGLQVTWKVPNANTAAATVNVDGLGAKGLWKFFNQALEIGDLKVNQVVTMVYESITDTWQMVSPTGLRDQDTAVIGAARNLVITNNGAAPDSKVTISADEVVVKSSTRSVVLSNVSTQADITASGAGGLDTGVEAATWYCIWMIYNPSTSGPAALLSLSDTAPTMPAGYTFKALIGAVYNGGSNFTRFYQQDRRVFIRETNALVSTAPSVAGTYQSLSISTLVPGVARTVFGVMGNGTNALCKVRIAGDAFGLGACVVTGNQNGTADAKGFFAGGFFEVPLVTGQVIYWTADVGQGLMDVCGFTI